MANQPVKIFLEIWAIKSVDIYYIK